MTINLQTGGAIAPQILPGARVADTQVVQKQIESSPEFILPAPGTRSNDAAASPEQRRLERITQAAQSIAGSALSRLVISASPSTRMHRGNM